MAHEYQTANFQVIVGEPPDFVGSTVIGVAYLARVDALRTKEALLADAEGEQFDPATLGTMTYDLAEQGSSIILTDAAVDRATFLQEVTNEKYSIVLFAKYNDGTTDHYVRFAVVPISLLRTLDP